MKKATISVVCICLILLFSISNAFGTTANINGAEIKATNYVMAIANISLNGSIAKASASITGVLGKTTKTSIHLYLQQYKNGGWITFDDWTSSGATANRSLSKSKTVTKGYKYRTKAICAAYVGSSKETITKYSGTVTYN